MKWINTVREKAKTVNRLTIADAKIGSMLARYPETNKNWQVEEIYKIIEVLNSKEINDNFNSGLFNKRGSSSRLVSEGGKIERDHAKHFSELSKKIKSKYPGVASIFEKMAKYYLEDARRMDESAQQNMLD
ncbi:MAG: hypothetical protein IPJ60_01460 [Sphingobacteriaceae bacterium]|nr:hypothetical protein [Sphingobacteriaceae bacterium]